MRPAHAPTAIPIVAPLDSPSEPELEPEFEPKLELELEPELEFGLEPELELSWEELPTSCPVDPAAPATVVCAAKLDVSVIPVRDTVGATTCVVEPCPPPVTEVRVGGGTVLVVGPTAPFTKQY